mmetsp:Transcript_37449/g.83334  ORF Transcript_37449/g.83334 Transcript_37449/m.83334 type:complete len:429 (-) Transcript_37449:478-1764(-)|eukprot:CAMPEP_0202901538 /NCGR_PEP_ID=MMETSP1392-20130828/14310_1 /ASSEMBLY_ACC=CAM_ASM_000868 /TAXON_ID=225041 /ORGANISM="Chlamydomonas chlamydogama, Strain SAG 11-48b" /LENGTH=428 /DNA_ID=CAMNT_0049588113 /DNA_START=137 /DNA_END=1423 /DNA_ORIENTATION=-
MPLDPLSILNLARDNKVREIEITVKLGIPPDIANQMGQTALHIAALWGNVEALDKLLELGGNPNAENMRGQTPLHFAADARKNALAVCQVLLKYGAKIDIMDMAGRVPYECAEEDEIRTLLGGPDSRLFKFAQDGKAVELRELLTSGAVTSLRVVDSQGRTPMNLAVTEEHMEVIKVLLAHDPAVLDLPDSCGDTPLHCAVDGSSMEVLKYLLSLKPKVDMQNLNQSEYAAGNWMLEKETIMPYDKTPLHIAVDNGDAERAQLLLEAGANVNLLDFDKRSALHLALEVQDMAMIGLLLEHGADVNQPSQDYVSALHYAASRGPVKLLQLLLEKGANVALENKDGWTPLHLAARSGNAEKVAHLVKAQSPVSAVNAQGNTALHLAAINGHVAAVQKLLEGGADRTAKNKEGKTPEQVAKNAEVKAALAA